MFALDGRPFPPTGAPDAAGLLISPIRPANGSAIEQLELAR